MHRLWIVFLLPVLLLAPGLKAQAQQADYALAAQIFDSQSDLHDTDDRFGSSVALEGNTLVVGAPFDDWKGTDSGSVFVYDATTGDRLVELSDPNPGANRQFGRSIAIDNNRVVVSATGVNPGGAAFLFDATTGQHLQTYTAPGSSTSDIFGESVDISGNRVVVGAWRADRRGVNSDTGEAYLFDMNTGALIRPLTSTYTALNSGDAFGISVAISNSFIAVGAANDDNRGPESGSVVVFNASSGTFVRTLNASDGGPGDQLGFRVAIDGNLIVAGAAGYDGNGTNAGAAYVFDAQTGAQRHRITNTGSPPNQDDAFGIGVAIEGTRVLVGARFDNGNATDSGAAYLYELQPFSNTPLQTFTPAQTASDDSFGYQVALDGDIIAISAPRDDDQGVQSGSVFLFNRSVPVGPLGNVTQTIAPQTFAGTAGDPCENASFFGGISQLSASSSDANATDISATFPGACELRQAGDSFEIEFTPGAETFTIELSVDYTGNEIGVTIIGLDENRNPIDLNSPRYTRELVFNEDRTETVTLGSGDPVPSEEVTMNYTQIRWTYGGSSVFFTNVAAQISNPAPASGTGVCSLSAPRDAADAVVTPVESSGTPFNIVAICETLATENVLGFEFGVQNDSPALITVDSAADPWAPATGAGDFFEISTLGGTASLNTLGLYAASRQLTPVDEGFGVGTVQFTPNDPIQLGNSESDPDPVASISFITNSLELSNEAGTPYTTTEFNTSFSVTDTLDALVDLEFTLASDGTMLDAADEDLEFNVVAFANGSVPASPDVATGAIASETGLLLEDNTALAVSDAFSAFEFQDADSPLDLLVVVDSHINCVAQFASNGGFALHDQPDENNVRSTATLTAGDVDNDDAIGSADEGAIVAIFGNSATTEQADINNDGTINVLDLVHVGRNFGASGRTDCGFTGVVDPDN